VTTAEQFSDVLDGVLRGEMEEKATVRLSGLFPRLVDLPTEPVFVKRKPWMGMWAATACVVLLVAAVVCLRRQLKQE
jgi:hypothetical protein